ncbi:heavy metal-associated isoprenylated plant protein 28-like [Curcuma longa]|uniref:heavy metal-associated isoprenylated plant protein 28-like n=1 Tax=Curcuma longa TaxID=136217 RepID=UPI003D9DC5FF
MTIVEMLVHMDCSGCESKIRKALLKLEGVHDVDVNVVMQKVTVTGWVEEKKALRAVRKTGRRAVLWPYLMNPELVVPNQEYYHLQQYTPSAPPANLLTFNAIPSTSSYNYRKHGYDSSMLHRYYYQNPAHSLIIDESASAMFSDDNPRACSIM